MNIENLKSALTFGSFFFFVKWYILTVAAAVILNCINKKLTNFQKNSSNINNVFLHLRVLDLIFLSK